ncbi:MAG TPA: prolipoprotein diacylglyceryl transferase [Clostridia bacterium]|nr:prolipoprotein diacylglyceryl transferase [Clostridia bacterium]
MGERNDGVVDPIAIKIGPFPIHWYGVLIASALALGTYLAYKEAERQGLNPEHILNLVLVAVPLAFVGARIYYVVFEWEQYGGNLLEMISVWHGGLAIHGGLLGGIIGGYFYVRRQRLNFWQMADVVAPSIILGQAIGRWGNFFNQEAHGGPVSPEFMGRFPSFIQEGMLINGQYYHPTFLYESLWNLSVFLFLLWWRKRKGLVHGQIFLNYLILYSVGRFFIEGLRTDSLMLGPFRVAQLVSVGLILFGVFYQIYLRKKAYQAPAGR